MARESGCRRGAVKKVDFIFVHLLLLHVGIIYLHWNHSRQRKDVCANNCFILLCEEEQFCFLLIVFTFFKIYIGRNATVYSLLATC